MKCQHCGYDNRDIDTLCSQCGKTISPEYPYSFRTCVSCQFPLDSEIRSCPHCGATNAFRQEPPEMEKSMRLDPMLTPLQTVDIEVYPDRVIIDERSSLTSIRRTTTASRSNWRASNIILSVIFLAQAVFLAYLWVKTGEGVILFVSALMAIPGIVTLVLFLQSESGRQESD